MRAGLAEDPAWSARTERADDVGQRLFVRPSATTVDRRRRSSASRLAPGVARQHERSRLEQRVSAVISTASREEATSGAAESEGVPQLGVSVGGGGKIPPAATSLGAGAQDSGADEHDVRERPQQAHEEAVGVVVRRQ